MTASEVSVPDRPRARSAVKTGMASFLLLVGGLVAARALGEEVYDRTFANMAFDVRGLASVVSVVFAVGYAAEIAVSVLAGPLLDRRSPLRVVATAYGLKLGLFALVGLAGSLVSDHVLLIVAAAASVDLFHHIGEMGLVVYLPRVLDDDALVKVQGISASVRSASELVGPLAAGLSLTVLPGARALLVAAGFQLAAVGLVMVLARWSGRQEAAAQPAPTNDGDDLAPAGASPTRRQVAREIWASPEWRGFVALDTVTIMIVSTAVLTWIPFLRDVAGASAAGTGPYIACSAAGGIVGGVLLTRVPAAQAAHGMPRYCLLMAVALVSSVLLAGVPAGLGLAMFGFGTGFVLYVRSTAVLLQTRAPRHVLGTWYGLVDAVGRVGGAVSILVAGAVFDVFGGRSLYLALATVMTLSWWGWSRWSTAPVPPR